ncbi:MAG: response regulator transcription factor [Candidatus Nanopelagicales bacterium]|jgi:DNA-binding NarL/FixJ family response regulator
MSVDSRPIRVAVLDDHPLVREGLAALLAVPHTVSAPFGVDVITVGEDLEGALDAHPDVVLLDIVMEDDVPIVHKVRRCLDRGAEVLLMSATAPPSKILSGLRAGALGFLPKTASVDEVRTAVADVARGEVHLTVDLAAVLAADPERPNLSPQELKALRLYAAGGKIATIARTMEVSPYTVKEYLDRVRTKYAAIGRQARTRTELYVAADRDGFLDGVDPLSD